MRVYDLNRDQLTELKQNYLTQKLDEQGDGISYEELAFIDDYVSDEEIFEEYAGTEFVNDDFACSAGQEEEDLDNGYRFIITDVGRNEAFYLHAINGIEYQWTDWAADTFSKREAQNALYWARKNGYPNAKSITIIN